MFIIRSFHRKKSAEWEYYRHLLKKTSSRGKTPYAAGELVVGVNNPAVFLRKILGLFSMAKRQNSSMQHKVFFHYARFFEQVRSYLLILFQIISEIFSIVSAALIRIIFISESPFFSYSDITFSYCAAIFFCFSIVS